MQDSAFGSDRLPQTIRRGVFAFAPVQNWRTSEAVAIAYFFYTAILASLHRLSWPLILVAWSAPIGLGILAAMESRYSQTWSRILRDWAPLALILAGYWEMNWFATPATSEWNDLWIGLDRRLLSQWGLGALLERFGGVLPGTLEAVYLLLYAIPPACLAALYFSGARSRADRFLFTLFLGTFAAYALLPYFPSTSPRIAFPGENLPHYAGIWRSWNIRLLDRYDISTSVFPSGHVAVAFSSGFGMLRAVPRKPWLWGAVFAAASLVFLATVYGRYHYAADGIASIGISTAAWLVSEGLDRHE